MRVVSIGSLEFVKATKTKRQLLISEGNVYSLGYRWAYKKIQICS